MSYIYNNQQIALPAHIYKASGISLSGTLLEKQLKDLQLNKDFFVVPKAEARKLFPTYRYTNAIFFTREGCHKIFTDIIKKREIPLTAEEATTALNILFGEPALLIQNEAFNTLNETLEKIESENPILQLIIDKAAEKVADRIMNRISA